MASIRRRTTRDGAHRYDVRLRVGGRVVTRTFRRRADADRWARLTEAGRELGGAVDPRVGTVRLEEYARRWIESRELAPRTRELYEHLLRRHVAPALGDVALTRLTPESVRLWNARLAREVSPLQAAKCYRLLRAILNTAVADDALARNPCRIPGAGRERSDERPLVTPEEVLAVAA